MEADLLGAPRHGDNGIATTSCSRDRHAHYQVSRSFLYDSHRVAGSWRMEGRGVRGPRKGGAAEGRGRGVPTAGATGAGRGGAGPRGLRVRVAEVRGRGAAAVCWKRAGEHRPVAVCIYVRDSSNTPYEKQTFICTCIRK